MAVTSAGLFIAMNPLLYNDTIARTAQLLSIGHLSKVVERNATLPRRQARSRGEALLTPGAKLYWCWRMSFVDQWVLVRGERPSAASAWHVLGVLLTAIGLAALARDVIRDHRAGRSPARACFLLWVLVSVAGVLVWTPFRWPRYYLYLFPLWALLIGHGAELSGRAALGALGVARTRVLRARDLRESTAAGDHRN